MKKLLSILLAVILAFSAFTMVSFAEETTDAPADVTDAPTDISDSMYAKWMDEQLNSNVANAELAIEATFSGEDAPVNIYIKGGKIAIEISRKIGLFNSKLKMITDINSGNIKIYFPILPFFYMNFDASSDYVNDFADIPLVDYSDLVLESVGKVQESGTEYYVEEFRNTEVDADMDCYFKDGELVRIEMHGSDSSAFIAEVSCDVSDKDVELPFYAFIDVTPLLTLFETLFGLI